MTSIPPIQIVSDQTQGQKFLQNSEKWLANEHIKPSNTFIQYLVQIEVANNKDSVISVFIYWKTTDHTNQTRH